MGQTRVEIDVDAGDVPDDFLASVLERTTGRLRRATERLARDLPGIAEIDPGPAFVEAVLQRTSRRQPTWRQRVRPQVSRPAAMWLRPRFTLVSAYAAAVAFVSVLGIAGASPAALAGAVVRAQEAAVRSAGGLAERVDRARPVVRERVGLRIAGAFAAAEHSMELVSEQARVWLGCVLDEVSTRAPGAGSRDVTGRPPAALRRLDRGRVTLLVVGVILLAHTLFGISLAWIEQWWPVVPIALGAWLVWRAVVERRASPAGAEH